MFPKLLYCLCNTTSNRSGTFNMAQRKLVKAPFDCNTTTWPGAHLSKLLYVECNISFHCRELKKINLDRNKLVAEPPSFSGLTSFGLQLHSTHPFTGHFLCHHLFFVRFRLYWFYLTIKCSRVSDIQSCLWKWVYVRKSHLDEPVANVFDQWCFSLCCADWTHLYCT